MKLIIRFIVRIIPLMLVAMVLIGNFAGLKAEMVNENGSVALRGEQADETAKPQETSSASSINRSHNIAGAGNTGSTGSSGIPGNGDTAKRVSSASSIRRVNDNTGSNVNHVIGNPVATNPGNGSFINPLTGQNTVLDLTRVRPVAISVSNQRGALPTNATNGISQADIVYELLVEGGITRFIALYQDYMNVGVVGSIRSARHYTVELAEAYNAIFIHAGGSPLGFEEVDKRGITACDAVRGIRADIFHRDVNRIPGQTVENYHSVTTSGARMTQWFPIYDIKLVHDNNYKQALKFTNNPIPSGNRAHDVTVKFSSHKNSIFTYNESQNLYYMAQFGSQFKDANNNASVAFTNLLIIETPVSDLVGHGEGAGRQDMSTVGSGKGYFVNGGKVVNINWSRTSKSSQFVYTLENGNEIELGRGKTYIGIIPTGTTPVFS